MPVARTVSPHTQLEKSITELKIALTNCMNEKRELAEELAATRNQRVNFNLKSGSTTYASHIQYAIVNSADTPMNHWALFTNPATSIHLYQREDIAEEALAKLIKDFPRDQYRFARVVKVCVTFPKAD